jgi:hypothetical protein
MSEPVAITTVQTKPFSSHTPIHALSLGWLEDDAELFPV